MRERPPLAIVVPLANEADTVEAFLGQVTSRLLPGDAVYCVLDLASRDDTQARVRRQSEADKRVHLVWAPEDRGVGDAYRRGYAAALQGGAEWIVEMDGGMSHLPSELGRFMDALSSGAEFAAGSRFAHGGAYRGPFTRRLLSRGGTAMVNALLGTRMCDMTSGYEAFTRPALEAVLASDVRSRGHFFQTEVRVAMHERRWAEVPITYAALGGRVRAAEVGEAAMGLFRLWRRRRSTRPHS